MKLRDKFWLWFLIVFACAIVIVTSNVSFLTEFRFGINVQPKPVHKERVIETFMDT